MCFDEKEVRFVCGNADYMHACICAMNYLKNVKCVSFRMLLFEMIMINRIVG